MTYPTSNLDYGDGVAAEATSEGSSAPTEVSALRPYTAALARAKANTDSCDVLVIGTSVSESGSNGASGEEPYIPYTARWQDVFRDLQREKLFQTPVGGVGFKPGEWATALVTPEPYTAKAGTWGGDPYGLGRRAVSTSDAAASRTYVETCTGFDIWYTGGASLGEMWYTVDGGEQVTFSQVNATTRSGLTHSVTGLSDAEHTIVVGRHSGTVYLEGIAFFRGDETTGFRVWDGARSASNSGTFLESVNPSTWWGVVTTIQPDLVVIEQGINETLGGISAATFKTNIESLITSIRSRTTVDPPIVLMALWAKSVDPLGTQAPFKTAMEEIADADDGVLYFDAGASTYRDETESAANVLGLLEDGTHATEAGSAALAIGLSNFLDARSVVS